MAPPFAMFVHRPLGARVSGRVWVHGEGTLRFGTDVHLDASTAPIELRIARGAELSIGDHVYVGGGVSIEAERSIRIGSRCRIGAFSKIIDTHFHRLDGDRHQRTTPRFVIVEDDVDLGPKSVLLPCAHIGRGSIVHAQTVVT